jgi:hypothetical protein
MTTIRLLVLLLVLSVSLLGASGTGGNGLSQSPGGTVPCSLIAGMTCYYDFSAATDTAIYSVRSCKSMTYVCDGDGTADLLIYEYRDSEGNGGNVWTDDMDHDGDVDAADEAITLDCTAGKRGFRQLAVGKPYHKLDVQTAPGSGSAYVTMRCNGGDK